MGCDIHPHFEIFSESKWEYGPWNLIPADYWWYKVIEEDLKNRKSLMAFGINEKKDPKGAYDALKNYYKSLSLNEVEQKFGHRSIYRMPEWEMLPLSIEATEAEEKGLPKPNWYCAEIRSRHYEWFNLIAGVRGLKESAIWQPRGIPDDVSRETEKEVYRMEGDAHTHSWLMVSEILQEVKLKNFQHYRWLEKFVTEPHRTRMVFWFDN
jgi:hypothetical protein